MGGVDQMEKESLDLEAIEARANAATEGPWEADNTEVMQHWSRPEPWQPIATNEVACMAYCYGGSARGIENEADAEFIAHAREDVPALIAEVRRLRAAVESVLALHPWRCQGCETSEPEHCGPECGSCYEPWPCPTVAAIEGEWGE